MRRSESGKGDIKHRRKAWNYFTCFQSQIILPKNAVENTVIKYKLKISIYKCETETAMIK